MKALTKTMVIAALAFSMLFTSCNSDIDYTYSEPTPPNYKITPAGAIENLKDFMSAFDASRSNSRDIKDVKAICGKRHSRGGDASGSGDTLLYIINFEDNQGFALVGADERTEPIFAIVDEGNYAIRTDTIPSDSCKYTNPGWNDFVEGAEAIAEWDVWYNDGIIVTSKGWNINNKRSPMLITKWGQSGSGYYTYGRYCPNNITGCTVTATAQILSLYQHINYLQWNYKGQQGFVTLNWMRIISDCKANNGTLLSSSTSLSLDEIALLCRYLGIMFNADYTSTDATSAKEYMPVDWFNEYAGLNATQLASYNEDNIIDAIRAGSPVYAVGYNATKEGHAWVLDGYVIASRDDGEKKFLHCNWGWDGHYNGYFLSRVFNATAAGVEIEDHEVTNSRSDTDYNFNTYLKYSIISRPKK